MSDFLLIFLLPFFSPPPHSRILDTLLFAMLTMRLWLFFSLAFDSLYFSKSVHSFYLSKSVHFVLANNDISNISSSPPHNKNILYSRKRERTLEPSATKPRDSKSRTGYTHLSFKHSAIAQDSLVSQNSTFSHSRSCITMLSTSHLPFINYVYRPPPVSRPKPVS